MPPRLLTPEPRRPARVRTPPQAPRRSSRVTYSRRGRQTPPTAPKRMTGSSPRRGAERRATRCAPKTDGHWLRSLSQPPVPELRRDTEDDLVDDICTSSSSSDSDSEGYRFLDDIVDYEDESDLSIRDNEDESDLSIRDNVPLSMFLQQRDTERAMSQGLSNTGGMFYIPTDVVPAQNHDPTFECGGTWRQVNMGPPDRWRLVGNLTEMELMGVQMRLGDLERQPSPPPPPPQQQQQEKEEERPREVVEEDNKTIPCCRVCLDKPVKFILPRCGHYCLCRDCKDELVRRSPSQWINCPVCRCLHPCYDGPVEVFM